MMKIIKASPSHIADLVKIEEECFEDNYSEKTLLSDIKNKLNEMYIALEDDRVVGYINVFHIFEEANLVKIAVIEGYRRLGIATKLLDYVTQKLVKQGVTKMYLEVSDKNEKAIKFYKKNGFEETTKRENYYKDLSDAIIMWKYF